MSYIDLISSAIGTAVAEIITLPICTIKTNYQTHLHYKSIFHTYKNIMNTYGIRGFYSALYSSLFSQVASTATKFTFYSYIKNLRNTQQKDIKNNILNGAIGGIMSSIIVHPTDVCKVHQQNNMSFINELRKIGPSLMYRGYSKSLAKNIFLTALIYPFYDFYTATFSNFFIAAILSSITVTLILHPIDYLKIRHISGQNLYLDYSSIPIYFKYYYRGLHINLIRIIPHFMITMFITENIKKKYT